VPLFHRPPPTRPKPSIIAKRFTGTEAVQTPSSPIDRKATYRSLDTVQPESKTAILVLGRQEDMSSMTIAAAQRVSDATPAAALTLVLGGARSGKSRYAERLIAALPPPWAYVATAEAGDREMAERIAAHRARRGTAWQTVEAPHELAGAIAGVTSTVPLLIDCLTLWLSNRILAEADLDAEVDQFERALSRPGPVVIVANEVGSGIVPDNALARRFRDLHGSLNQRIAARAGRVILMVAGLPLTVKGTP
jgi:adenosylcobinamide kinase / adenosylcobinamide-phosphate guanylyltransferase